MTSEDGTEKCSNVSEKLEQEEHGEKKGYRTRCDNTDFGTLV
jgi:hypothetical protein